MEGISFATIQYTTKDTTMPLIGPTKKGRFKKLSAGKAAKLLDRLGTRRLEGLTTPKQIRFLENKGFLHVGTWQFEDARKLIDRIAGNGWRVPLGITPAQYAPGGMNA